MIEGQDHPRQKWSTRFTKNLMAVMILVTFAAVTYIQSTFSLGFDLQSARCLPWVAYWITKDADARIDRGSIYALRINHDEQLANRTLLKMAAGMPGDIVTLNQGGVWINKLYWGPMHPVQVKRLQSEGKNPFTSYVIPKGKLLMLGTLPQSYDGRYVGLVDTSAIEGRASPLW